MSEGERLPPDVEALLAAERDAPGPDGEARSRVAARLSQTLGVALAAGAGASSAVAAGKAAAGSAAAKAIVAKSLATKLIVATLIAAAGGGAAISYQYLRAPKPSRAPLTSAAPMAPAPTVAATAPEPAPVAPATAPSPASPPPHRAHHADLAAERALLGDARTALQGSDAARALATLDDHARRFPRGQLAEERDALRIRALWLAGDRDAARRRADDFAARHPDSLFLPSVRRAVTDSAAPSQ